VIPYTNFTKGEIAPELQARIDTNQYQAGARRVRNFIIQRYGGLAFRPGFRFVGEVDNPDHNIRYLPFQYNIEQSYIMALEDQQMRFLTGGGFVLEEDLQITAISKAANAQLTVAFHDYVVGQRLYFSGIVGMTELNYQTGRVVSVVDANNFTIDIDTTSYSTFVSSVGTARVGAPTPVPPDPAPPAPPPAEPDPPLTSGGGGSGSDVGELPGWKLDMLNRGGVD
jgi:hypothetical protein